LLLEFADGFLVQHRLLLGQSAIRLHLGLVRKVGDHPLVGLEPAKEYGPTTIGVVDTTGFGGAFIFLTRLANAFAERAGLGFR